MGDLSVYKGITGEGFRLERKERCDQLGPRLSVPLPGLTRSLDSSHASNLGNRSHNFSRIQMRGVAKFSSMGTSFGVTPLYKGKAFDLHKMHLKLSPPSQKKKDRGVVREQELVIPAGLYSFEVVDKG
jgi:hypothetical protein